MFSMMVTIEPYCIFSPYSDRFYRKNYYNMVKKNTVYICVPHCWLPGKL